MMIGLIQFKPKGTACLVVLVSMCSEVTFIFVVICLLVLLLSSIIDNIFYSRYMVESFLGRVVSISV